MKHGDLYLARKAFLFSLTVVLIVFGLAGNPRPAIAEEVAGEQQCTTDGGGTWRACKCGAQYGNEWICTIDGKDYACTSENGQFFWCEPLAGHGSGHKGKLKVTSSGGGSKFVYGAAANGAYYCVRYDADGNSAPDSAPFTPLQVNTTATLSVEVSPYDCNRDGIQEYLGDGQGIPRPDVDDNGLYDINYVQLLPGTTYWSPEGGANSCMTPWSDAHRYPTGRVHVIEDAMNVGTDGTGTYSGLVLDADGDGDSDPGDYTVCVSAETPNPLAGDSPARDWIQTSVSVI